MSTELNLNTKSKVAELVDTLVAYLPEILGIDETIPGSIVTDLDPFGVGVGVYPRFIEVALRNQYRQYVRYLSDSGLAVSSSCIIQHLRDGNIYVVMGGGGVAPGGVRSFGVPASGGSNGTCLVFCDPRGVAMANSAERYVYGMFVVPEDYDSVMTVTAIVVPSASGDLYSQNYVSYGACGEGYQTHSDSEGPDTVAVTLNQFNCIQEITLSTVAVGDIVLCQFWRDATDPSDTVEAIAYVPGWKVEYVAAY